MSTYIEPIIIQSFLLDYLISATAYRFLRMRAVLWRILLVAMFGTVVALIFPLLDLPWWGNALIKSVSGTFSAWILFSGKCKYYKGALAYYIATFLYCGCVLCFETLGYGSVKDALNKPLPLGFLIVTATAIALYGVVKFAVTAYHRRSTVSRGVLAYKMDIGGKTVCGSGFMDTGNGLYDSVTGLPVVIVELRALIPYLSESEFTSVITGKVGDVFRGARKTVCGSLGGRSEIWLIEPSEFRVYSESDGHIIVDVMVGLSFSPLSGGEQYDAILHPALTEVK